MRKMSAHRLVTSRMTVFYGTVTLLVGLVISPPAASVAFAQHANTGGHSGSHEGSAHGFHPHHVALFGGGTYDFDEEEAFGTVGADYVYRFAWNEGRIGVGVFGEVIFADHAESLLGVPLYLYLTRELWLRAGPGVEFLREEEHDHHGSGEGSHGKLVTETEFLFRVGLGYALELGNGFSITPSLDYDILRDKEALVFGISIGKGFSGLH